MYTRVFIRTWALGGQKFPSRPYFKIATVKCNEVIMEVIKVYSYVSYARVAAGAVCVGDVPALVVLGLCSRDADLPEDFRPVVS
eukprot:COSAG02_NODE_32_length_50374_cov_46.674013_13_plen_84_part_00